MVVGSDSIIVGNGPVGSVGGSTGGTKTSMTSKYHTAIV